MTRSFNISRHSSASFCFIQDTLWKIRLQSQGWRGCQVSQGSLQHQSTTTVPHVSIPALQPSQEGKAHTQWLYKILNCDGRFDKDTDKDRCPRNQIWAQIQVGHLCSNFYSVCSEGRAACRVWSWTFPEIKRTQYSVLALGTRYQTNKPFSFSLRLTIALDDKKNSNSSKSLLHFLAQSPNPT